jgi:hypothetical protein
MAMESIHSFGGAGGCLIVAVGVPKINQQIYRNRAAKISTRRSAAAAPRLALQSAKMIWPSSMLVMMASASIGTWSGASSARPRRCGAC